MLIYYFLIAFPVTALVSLIVYLPFGLRSRQPGRGGIWFHLPRFALVGCCLSLLYLTILWYYPDIHFFPGYYFLNLRPFIWVTQVYDMGLRKMLWQLAMNIAMFLPFGLLLPMVFQKQRRLSSAALTVLLTTVSIEAAQLCMGRSADIDDVIMNFLGGLLGYSLFALLDHFLKGRSRWGKMLGIA